ncbi:Sterol O-acyltransferase 1 [Echinococcus granulosus]|uniref:Sterol O acyltransferase 1 n=2 Tax=Echinococcus granulosus TaxID=6210 RepID=A0A068WIX1_ECHGR|nr:Sterol O-acyltransferase 1 [Echinococcus granulosus]CDS18387.1 sterol O acyltransferase 1 [Echinococcus granulosus]
MASYETFAIERKILALGKILLEKCNPMTDTANLSTAPDEAEQVSGGLEPQTGVHNCSCIKKPVNEMASSAIHSSKHGDNDTSQTVTDEIEHTFHDPEPQTEVRNRSHLTKPVSGVEFFKCQSSDSTNIGKDTATQDEITNVSGEPDLQTSLHNCSHHTELINEVDTSDSPNESEVGRKTSMLALELYNQLRTELTQDFSYQLQRVLENAVDRILKHSEAENLVGNSNRLKSNMSDKLRVTSGSDKWLPEKNFCHRNSVLTDLFKISHIETVYHIFIAVLLIFALNTVLSDVVEKGGVVHVYHFELLVWTFKGFFNVFHCWITMFLSTSLFVYLAFIMWASKRKPVHKFTNFDFAFVILYVIYQVAFAILPVVFIFKYDIAPSSTAIVCLEQIRLMMKSHAFVRANIGSAMLSGEECEHEKARRRRRRPLTEDERFPVSACGDSVTEEVEITMSNGIPIPPFSQYLYFLFAPTLVYRSAYPRTPYIRWHFVTINLLQMGLCIVYTYFIFARFCFAYFANFGRSEQFNFSLRQLITSSFGCMLPGALLLLINFYAFLHCWLNAFAELLRFGDRLFYKDWWNSITFSAYYRTWNVVVHDWLYTYVYRDVYAISGRNRRMLAQTAVFMLSAIVHEYVLTVVFRFFYPVLFIIFGGVGFAIANLRGRSRLWNVGLWAGLFMGMGILMCLYSMEWYARKNCPPAQGLIDLFIPRSWFCGN